MLYVAIWYVSIRPVVMRVKEEPHCSSSFTLITTHSIRTLLKMDYWSPKYVELLNVTNKIDHQISCILFDYRYIVLKMFRTVKIPTHYTATTTNHYNHDKYGREIRNNKPKRNYSLRSSCSFLVTSPCQRCHCFSTNRVVKYGNIAFYSSHISGLLLWLLYINFSSLRLAVVLIFQHL